MKTSSRLLLLWVILSSFLSPVKLNAETIHQWEVLTLSFKTAKNYINPYAQIPVTKNGDLMQVIFEGVSGQAKDKKITLVGFWAGDSEWKVNFAPPYTGDWKYKSVSKDKSLDGKEGKFKVIPWTEAEKETNPTRRGFIRVMQAGANAGHYFEYSDGHPFLWIGDTWWNWTKKDIHFDTFKKLVDDRAAKGFNIGQLFIPGNGWKKENSLLDTTYSVLDTSHMQRVEEMIRYANSKGITIWIHGWWGGKDLDKEVGKEKMLRWWRYLIHRFSAYNVIWVLAGEYNVNNYGGLGLDFWNELGKMVKHEDSYGRITSVHNTPPYWFGGKDAPQWTTGSVLNKESWLDYNQCQVGHGKFANEMIPQCVSYAYNLKPTKPIVVTEPWYEFTAGDASASDIRFGAWSAILSGAAGHSYGGGRIWIADVPESPEKEPSDQQVKGGSTLDYEGAMSMEYLASFFQKIDWWTLASHPDLVTEYPQPFCLANPGKEYVIYLRYGGVAKVHLGHIAVGKKISYYWFDPSSGKIGKTTTITGSEYLSFECPNPKNLSTPENKDWVLYIKEQN
ncbi:MAG: DUF4038 domain-containing protein [Peptostreptococcaceae bacterium]|nr:DUF4038 domain-containing protein [Peptostreptococcaceae bacterium]